MMVICIELRIPMFLVGKPGSSKSLAKSTVADTLQGSNSAERLFKNYKQVTISIQMEVYIQLSYFYDKSCFF